MTSLSISRTRGFTLVEILVAFMMLALVGGALLQLFQGGMRNIDSSRHYTYASLLARSKLTELMAIPNLTEGIESGRFDDTYRWSLQLTPYVEDNDEPLPDARARALRADLKVQWDTEGEYRLTTLLLTREAP